MKKILLVLLLLLTALPFAVLADDVIPANGKHERPVIEGLDEDGFMSDGSSEYVLADPDEGMWIYVSSSLRVEIDRYTASNRNLVWYTAHIWQKDGYGMKTYLSDPEDPLGSRDLVENIARKYHLVFAVNGDYFEDRYSESKSIGVIIRSGTVINGTPGNGGNLPTLDILALFGDGSMKCYDSRYAYGNEYIAMGVTDTLCFGPILVSEGEIEMDELTDYGRAREPRTALGMVEPGHYVAILCEGRSDVSDGIRLSELAPMMAAEGCVEAINLDGGQTSVMSFMGVKINTTGTYAGHSDPRDVTDIVGVGVSALVADGE